MIRYFKKFENDKYYNPPIFKKGDLAKSETSSKIDIFLILNDVYPTDERADAFFIGFVDKVNPYTFSFDFNEDIAIAVKKYTTRNYQLIKLKDSEKQLILDELNRGKRTKIAYDIKNKLELIERITGFNIIELPELVDYEVKTATSNYNL